MTDWVAAAWGTVIPIVTLFAVMAVALTSHLKKGKTEDAGTFISAKDQVSKWRIAWSFYAGAVGSWVIVSPSQYANYSGMLGLCFYALSSGFPLIIIALFGARIRDRFPQVTSSADWVNFRFGSLAQLYFVLCVLFNMSIAMLAEYTTMASLFKDFVGTKDYPIVIVIGVLTLLYTAYGGLLISIVTDQFQGALSIILAFILAIYLAATFRDHLEQPLTPELARGYGTSGFSSILVMPLSLLSATIFSEAVWQKAWASTNKSTLYFGGVVGCCATVVIVFFYGLCGFLATWAGKIDENTNYNLYLFQVFKDQNKYGNAKMTSWVSLLALIAAAVMSESAVDSLQTGLVATLSSYLLKGQPLWMTRAIIIVINIPLIVVGLQGYNVLSLFLITNMLCTASAFPIILGLVDSLKDYYTGDHMVFAGIFAILFTSGYGISNVWDPQDKKGSIQAGFVYTWYGQPYKWDYFGVACLSSVAGVVIAMATSALFRRLNVKLPSATAGWDMVTSKVSAALGAPAGRAVKWVETLPPFKHSAGTPLEVETPVHVATKL